jgi:arginyl-tRNA synthetase
MNDYRMELALAIKASISLKIEEIYSLIEIPPQSDMGDYAFPCFSLAKVQKKAPLAIAEKIRCDIEGKLRFIHTIEIRGGYLNFFLMKSVFIREVVTSVLANRGRFGCSAEGNGKTVLVEYSSPNIAKPFHVGHGFTTILGHALNNIYRHLGYQTVRLNHLGDYGTQFGKLICAYKRWGDEDALSENPIAELLRIYVKFHDEAKNSPELETEARIYFRNLENHSPEEIALWQRFRDLSLSEFNKIYKRLGVTFDDLNGESFYSDMIPEVVSILRSKNLLKESNGAQVVMLDEYNLPPCIILKSDGTTIYASRDVAAILYRIRKYKFFKNIYVVGNPQTLHFKQVFAVAQKMGYEEANSCIHVGFGLVKFTDMKFSTREGHIILLEELLNECVAKTTEIIRKNNEDRGSDMNTEEIEATAEKIGIGAVVYTFCKNSRDRDILFSWDEMLNFEGDSAPYVMYSYARCQSILRKAMERQLDTQTSLGINILPDPTDEEFALSKLLFGFEGSVVASAANNEPYVLVRHINGIARAFNKLYNNTPILSHQDPEIIKSRLALCQATAIALKTGLGILGIQTVERM